MKCYKERYDVETNKIYYVSFDTSNEFDFTHEPETNLYDATQCHSCDLSSLDKAINEINNDIENGKLKVEKCKDCNLYFYLPIEEINWFRTMNMVPPKRCPRCRSIRKKNKKEDK